MRFVEDISGISVREEAQAAGGVQQQTWGTGEERRAALTRRAVGAKVAETARLRQDTLKLEYPSLAGEIDRLLTKGWSRDDLRRHYADCERRALMFYGPQEVDAFLGRTDQTKRDLWDAMSAQRDDAYVRIMRDEMSEGKVRSLLHTAKSAGVAPGLLLRNHKDAQIMEAAERLAGTRMGVVDMTLSAVKNMVAQYQSSLAGKQRMDAQGLRQKMEDREALIEEGRRSLGLDMVREDEVPVGWEPPSDERLMEAGRASFEQRIAALEAGATKDEADAGEWHTHYRPPESELGAFILNGIENGAFTLKSAFLSGGAWAVGGPVTGLLMTAYNTIDESRAEAGEVFVEALRRGWDPKDAYEAAMKAERENVELLTATNYAFDILTFGLSGAGRGLVKLGGRAAKAGGALGRVGHFLEHGMSDWLSRQAGKITGDKLAARLARGAILRVTPMVAGAIPEGIEEYGQERIKMRALGDELDDAALAEAFKMGMGHAAMHSLIGLGMRRGFSWAGRKALGGIVSLSPMARAQKELDRKISEASEIGQKLARGEIEETDVVCEDPVLFVPRERLSDEALAALDPHRTVEMESGGVVDETVDAPEDEAQEERTGELAVRKSVWDAWAAAHPEEAAALADVLREGTQGVTAAERMAQIFEDAKRAAQDPLNADTEQAAQARAIADELFAEMEEATDLSPAVREVWGRVYARELLTTAERFGLSPRDMHRVRVQAGESPVEKAAGSDVGKARVRVARARARAERAVKDLTAKRDAIVADIRAAAKEHGEGFVLKRDRPDLLDAKREADRELRRAKKAVRALRAQGERLRARGETPASSSEIPNSSENPNSTGAAAGEAQDVQKPPVPLDPTAGEYVNETEGSVNIPLGQLRPMEGATEEAEASAGQDEDTSGAREQLEARRDALRSEIDAERKKGKMILGRDGGELQSADKKKIAKLQAELDAVEREIAQGKREKSGKREKRAPLVVVDRGDGTYTILDGNNTYAELKELGAESVPVVVEKPFTKGVTDEASLYAKNAEAEEEFHALMKALHEELGGELMERQQMKGRDRAAEKVENDYNGDWSRCVDVWGGSLTFETEEEILNALEKLKDRGYVVRIKDKWHGPDETGYRDVNLNIRLSKGAVVELQLHHRGIMDVKESVGHLLYEFIRKNQNDRGMDAYTKQAIELSRILYAAGIEGQYQTIDASLKASLLEMARLLSSQTSAREAEARLKDLSGMILNTFKPSSSEQIVLGASSKNSTANGTSSPFSKNRNMGNTPDENVMDGADGQNIPQGAGKVNGTARVRTASGTEIDVRYRVVSAGDLIASHGENGGVNEAYPKELQPRQRGREASIQQIHQMAVSLDPELLGENRLASDGAPIVGPDSVVESGNGRVMAIRRAYRTGKADGYRAWLTQNAERFGIDPADVEAIADPVLIRERTSDVDRVRFVQEANQSSVSRMSKTEQALADAQRITEEMLYDLDPDADIASIDNREFVKRFIREVAGTEANALVDAKGELSQDGRERIVNALFAYAYKDTEALSRLRETLDDDTKNVTNALLGVSPRMADMERKMAAGGLYAELSLREALIEAANKMAQIKRDGKLTVEAYLAQGMLFASGNISPEARAILQFFEANKRSTKAIRAGLARYVDLVEAQGSPAQISVFGDGPMSRAELVFEAFGREVGKQYASAEEIAREQGYGQDEGLYQLALAALRKAKDRIESYAQKMWHGSRHVLEGMKFKLEKIGTGEGAQAFGYGAYLAQIRDVSEGYRTAGMPIDPGLYDAAIKTIYGTYLGRERDSGIWQYASDDQPVAEPLAEAIKAVLGGADAESVKAQLLADLERMIEETEELMVQGEDALFDRVILDRARIFAKDINFGSFQEIEDAEGNLYHVEGPEDDELLDWDAPMEEQIDAVKEAFKEMFGDIEKMRKQLERGEKAQEKDMLTLRQRLEMWLQKPDGGPSEAWGRAALEELITSVVNSASYHIGTGISGAKSLERTKWAANKEDITREIAQRLLEIGRTDEESERKAQELVADMQKELIKIARRAARLADLGDAVFFNAPKTGEEFYRKLGQKLTGISDGDYWGSGINHEEADKAASMWLKDRGIPGHRYWDGFSRTRQDGTHNFVIWDVDLLEVMDVEGPAKAVFDAMREAESYGQDAVDGGGGQLSLFDNSGLIDERDALPRTEAADAFDRDDPETWSEGARKDEALAILEELDALDEATAFPTSVGLWMEGPRKAEAEDIDEQLDALMAFDAEDVDTWSAGPRRDRMDALLASFVEDEDEGVLSDEVNDDAAYWVDDSPRKADAEEVLARLLALQEQGQLTSDEAQDLRDRLDQLVWEESEAVAEEMAELTRAEEESVEDEIDALTARLKALRAEEEASREARAEELWDRLDELADEEEGETESYEQDAVAQTRTEAFKAWFGDWEMAQHKFNIVEAEPAPFNSVEGGIQWAQKNGIIGDMEPSETNGKGKIKISVSSVRKMLHSSQREKSVSPKAHFATLTKLRDIIRESELADRHPDYLKGEDEKRAPENGINPGVTIDVIYGALRFNGETYRVKTTLKRYAQTDIETKAYAYEVSEIEVLPEISQPESRSDSAHNTSILGNRLLQGVKNSKGNLVLEDRSKVVDENGKPLVVYHSGTFGARHGETVANGPMHFGTREAAMQRIGAKAIDDAIQSIETWEEDDGTWSASVEGDVVAEGLSSEEEAYAEAVSIAQSMEMDDLYDEADEPEAVFLNIRNPKRVRDAGGEWGPVIEAAKAEGHDGIVYRNEFEDRGSDSYIAFYPEQIKSATGNVGTFDTGDADIYHQTYSEDEAAAMGLGEDTAPAAETETAEDPGAGWERDEGIRAGATRGRVEFHRDSGEAIIYLMQSADPSTFLHEMWHVALDDLMLFGRREDAKEEVRKDWETVMDWLGVSDLDFSLFGLTKEQRAKLTDEQRARHERDMARWRVAQEKFADTGEAYLQTGKAPSKGLRGAFERIRAWLLKVYDGVKDDIEISDEIRDVFDRILATREEIDAEHEAQVTVGELATEEKLLRVRIFQLGGQVRRLEEKIREAQARGEDVSSLEREAARLWSRRKRIEAKRNAKKRLRNDIKRMAFQMEAAAKDGRVIYHRQVEIRELLKAYDVRPDDKKTRENRADVAAFLRAYPQHTEGLTEKELRYLGTTTLGEMTVAQVRELHDQVREIRRKGQLELELKELLRKEAIDAARKELLGPMLALHEARRKGKGPGAVRGRQDMGKDPEYAGFKGKVRRFADWTYANTLGAQRFFDHLDGNMGSFDGAWIKLFADRPNEARDEELRHILRRRSSIEKVMADLGLKPADLRQTRDVAGVPGRSGKAWTVDELMSIYAGMKNERSREAILYGNFKDFWAAGLDPEAAAAKCVAALTDKEKELADAIIKDYAVNFDRIDGALVDVFNKGMDKEENYTPMRRLEYTTAEGLMDPDSAEAMMNARARAGGMGKVERGFQQTRVRMSKKNQRAIDLGLVSIWNSQVEVQEHAAAFSGLIRDMRQILLGRSEGQELTVQALVNEVHGRAAWQQIKTYYGILARNDTKIAHDVLDSVAGALAKNMATAYLCGNLATALKQFPSFFRFLPYCGPVHLLKAIGEMMEKREAFFEECYELDPQLRNRMGNAMIAAMRTAGTLRGGKYGMALDAGMSLIGMVDRLASTIGWKAVYDANIKAGKSHEVAVREAQRAVLLTQPASQAKDMPRMWNQSGYAKLAMIFSMDAAQRFGITVYDLWAAVRAGKWPRFLWTLAGLTLGTMVVQALSDGGPDDWADIPELSAYWARAFARDAVSTLPLVGKEALAAWDMHMGDGYFKNGTQSAFVAPFAKLLSGARGVWDGKTEQGVLDLMEAGALAAPFPATFVRRAVRVGKGAADGDVAEMLMGAIGMRRKVKKMKAPRRAGVLRRGP